MGGLRWGPLLAWSFLHGMEFTKENGYLEPHMNMHNYLQVADDALEGIRFMLPQLGVQPRPRPPAAPPTLITQKFARSPPDTNRALLQARFMDLDMFRRFVPLEGLQLFFECASIMEGKLSVETAAPLDVAAWFLDSEALGGDQEAICGAEHAPKPAVFMHISQEWFLIAESRFDYVIQADYLHCGELSLSLTFAPCRPTHPLAQSNV